MVSAAVALLATPFYLRYLGLEAYGIVGFYAAVQGFLAILDVGFTPTMNREAAKAHATGEMNGARSLLRSLSAVTWSGALAIAVIFFISAHYVATHWLQAKGLSSESIRDAVAMLGFVIAVRWPMGVYTGALLGSQRVVALSTINIVMSIVSSGGAILVLHAYSPTIEAFFGWMLLANIVWMSLIRLAAWRALGGIGGAKLSMHALRQVWKFSMGMAATGILGAILTYSDRLVVSRMLPLEALGRYAVATQLAAVTALLVMPTVNVVYPALTRLLLSEQAEALEQMYRSGTRMLGAVLFPLATLLGAFAVPILALWTGDAVMAREVAPVLQVLLIGNALNGVMYFPYSLQMAAGASHFTTATAATLLIVLVPALYLLTWRYGAAGAAAAWALTNAIYVIIATLTHRFFLRGNGFSWLCGDVLLPLLVAVATVGSAGWLLAKTTLPPALQVGVGSATVLVSVAVVVGMSSGLKVHMRSLLPRR